MVKLLIPPERVSYIEGWWVFRASKTLSGQPVQGARERTRPHVHGDSLGLRHPASGAFALPAVRGGSLLLPSEESMGPESLHPWGGHLGSRLGPRVRPSVGSRDPRGSGRIWSGPRAAPLTRPGPPPRYASRARNRPGPRLGALSGAAPEARIAGFTNQRGAMKRPPKDSVWGL